MLQNKKKALLLLAAAQLLPQAISFATLPLIARLYSPIAIGEAYYWISVSTIATLIISGQLQYSVISAKSSFAATRALVDCTTAYTISIALLATTTLCLLATQERNLANVATLTVLLTFGQMFTALSSAALSRKNNLGPFTAQALARTVIAAGLQLGIPALAAPTTAAILSAYVIAELAGLLIVRPPLVNLAKLVRKKLKQKKCPIHHKYRSLVTTYMPAQAVSTIANFLPLVAMRQGDEIQALGLYAVLLRLVATPVNALSQSIRFLYAKITAPHPEKERRRAEIANFIGANIGALAIAAVIIAAPLDILQIILGNAWTGNAYPFAACVLWLGSSLGNTVRTERFRQTSQHAKILRVEIITLATKAIAICAITLSSTQQSVIAYFVLGYVSNLMAFALLNEREPHDQR